MTYGQIAALLEHGLSPRAVGWAMHGCPEGVPWQRVVNASGGCSTERMPDVPPGLQRALLVQEGVVFRQNGTLDLEFYSPATHRYVLAVALPTPSSPVTFAKVTHFGNWLRLAGSLPEGVSCQVVATLQLEG